MSWLGKILTVMVLILTLVWMWFTVTVFVARTNWKNQAELYKKAYDEAKGARTSEYDIYRGEKDSVERQLATEKIRAENLVSQVKVLQADNDRITDRVAKLAEAYQKADVQSKELTALYESAAAETKQHLARANQLEEERVKLVIARENAEKDRQAAQNEAKQATASKLTADQRIDALLVEVSELRQAGGRADARVLNSLNKPASPLPDGVRGTVEGYKDGTVAMSIGIDSGVTNGAILDVYRSDDGGKYLGTIVVDRASPKTSVGFFKPANPLTPISRLRPDELPKAGDTVGKIGNISAGR